MNIKIIKLKYIRLFEIILLLFFAHSRCEYFGKITILSKPIGLIENPWVHESLKESLLRGFNSLNVHFNYNPPSLDQIGETIWVITNTEALKQAIELKNNGLIKTLFVGPNMAVLPQEEPLLKNPLIDAIIVPSKEIVDVYALHEPEIKNRLYVWFAGVNTNYWQSGSAKRTNEVIVYWKTEPEEFCIAVESILKKYGYIPKRITYGNYTHQQYKDLLTNSAFAVFLSRSESQGIALAEAWSMNVPTLPWNPKDWHYKEFQYPLSSCPYLNQALGVDWNTMEEFEYLIDNIQEKLIHFTPREWAINNMSDEISAQCILRIIDDINLKTL